MRSKMWQAVSLCCAMLLAGCGSSTHTVVGGDGGTFSVDGDRVVLHGTADSTAVIAADGSLTVDDKAVAVTDTQRGMLVRYHATAMQFIDHAKDTGKAGAQIGATAAEEVVKGLTSGDTSKIGERIEAKVGPVKQAAAKLCDDLAVIRDLQTGLAAGLAAFRPFAVISPDEAGKCHKDLSTTSGPGAG